jgi:prepilin-type N-terminal cleavage/methylation domain-containing protein
VTRPPCGARGARLPRGDRDGGFTLVELLVAVAILGIVMAAMTAAMVVALTGDKESGQRLGESTDVSFTASYLADDAQGANTFSAGAAPGCGTDSSAVLELRGGSFTGTQQPVVTVVSYVLRPGHGSTRELHRLTCSGPQGSVAQVSDVVVARQVSAVTAPVAQCLQASGTATACSSAAAVTVRLLVTEESGFSFTLVGTRRTT